MESGVLWRSSQSCWNVMAVVQDVMAVVHVTDGCGYYSGPTWRIQSQNNFTGEFEVKLTC